MKKRYELSKRQRDLEAIMENLLSEVNFESIELDEEWIEFTVADDFAQWTTLETIVQEIDANPPEAFKPLTKEEIIAIRKLLKRG